MKVNQTRVQNIKIK